MGGISHQQVSHIRIPGSISPPWAAQICASDFTGAAPSSSIGLSGALLEEDNMFPYSKLPHSHLLIGAGFGPDQLICLFQPWLGLGCENASANNASFVRIDSLKALQNLLCGSFAIRSGISRVEVHLICYLRKETSLKHNSCLRCFPA